MNKLLFLSAVVSLAACASPAPKKNVPPPLAPVTASAPKTLTAQAAPAIPTAPAGKLASVYGQVVSYDAVTHRLSIKDKRGVTRTFVVASDAKLTKGGGDTAIDAGDLKSGEHVAVKCGGEIAAAVHVKVTAQPKSSGQVAKH